MISLILIHKGDFFKIKKEIYYQTMGVITKCKSNCHVLHKVILLNVIALEMAAIDNLLIIYANRNMRKYHTIIASMSVNYKEEVVITGIKSGMQYSIC